MGLEGPDDLESLGKYVNPAIGPTDEQILRSGGKTAELRALARLGRLGTYRILMLTCIGEVLSEGRCTSLMSKKLKLFHCAHCELISAITRCDAHGCQRHRYYRSCVRIRF